MRPYLTNDSSESDGDEEIGDRNGAATPELFHRRKAAQRTRKRAQRSRTNEMAKRGMHQRRNKRVAW
jgi:hypothetical protein